LFFFLPSLTNCENSFLFSSFGPNYFIIEVKIYTKTTREKTLFLSTKAQTFQLKITLLFQLKTLKVFIKSISFYGITRDKNSIKLQQTWYDDGKIKDGWWKKALPVNFPSLNVFTWKQMKFSNSSQYFMIFCPRFDTQYIVTWTFVIILFYLTVKCNILVIITANCDETLKNSKDDLRWKHFHFDNQNATEEFSFFPHREKSLRNFSIPAFYFSQRIFISFWLHNPEAFCTHDFHRSNFFLLLSLIAQLFLSQSKV
jgi:hypothetical protein